jgi:hypothetical protein
MELSSGEDIKKQVDEKVDAWRFMEPEDESRDPPETGQHFPRGKLS